MKHLRPYRGFALVLALLLCFVYPAYALAGNQLDPSAESTLTVMDQAEEKPISGVTFRLYKVADVTEELSFLETGDFKDTGVSITKDDSSWSAQASTLEAYVVERSAEGNAITPVGSGTTDSQGKVVFSKVPSGLYLLVGDTKTQGAYVYRSQPVLLTLPYQKAAASWTTEPELYAKNSVRELRDTPTEISVVKVWKDSGYTENRPQSVTVALYQDEKFYGSVALNAENSWRYTWDDLDSASDYYVVEQNVPSGYTVSTVQEGTAFVVTNTYTPPATPTPAPSPSPEPSPSAEPSPEPSTEPSPEPSPSESPEPSVSPAPEPSVSPSVSPAPGTTKPTPPTNSPTTTTTITKLPQTGQLWWPVTILALLGLVLLMLGWGIHRRGDDHES
jgi:hypothetical protein